MDFRDMAEAAHAAFVSQGWAYSNGVPSIEDLEIRLRNLVGDIPFSLDETCYAQSGRLRVEREVIQEDESEEPTISWNFYLSLS